MINIKNISRINTVALILMLLFSCMTMYAQQSSEEQVKRLQRTIFIYNLAGQVGWPSMNNSETFTIGVLGLDRTVIDLKAMASKRQIGGKTVQVVSISKVKDIKDIQLLYVNKEFNFDINYIISHIRKKGILLISEDYNYNTSMINMVSVGSSFEYEINKGLLIAENFTLAPSLEKYAVTSAEKWKNLYTSAKEKLEKQQISNTEKEAEISEKQNLILDKDKTIGEQKSELDNQVDKISASEKLLQNQKDSLATLLTDNVLQTKQYADKVILEKALEKTITEQIHLVEEQQQAIVESKKILLAQQIELGEKQLQIENKQRILEAQNLTIKDQRNTTILLAAIASLLLLGGLLLFFSYKSKRKIAKKLENKNNEVLAQSKLLVFKNKELEQFAYIASHDLQEPLNSIISLVGVLEEDYIDAFDESGKQSLLYITESSNRMRDLINALLKHSKLGKIDSLKPVDIQQLLSETTKDIEDLIKKTNTEINFNNMPIIMASKVELRLVFQNLITNAIKFVKPGTSPVINIMAMNENYPTHPEKDVWKFSITDNGIGIPQEYQERVFSIFQRLHNRDTYGGTGIGLAHVKKIIDAHGGKVWLESEEGKGSTFYFTIPMA